MEPSGYIGWYWGNGCWAWKPKRHVKQLHQNCDLVIAFAQYFSSDRNNWCPCDIVTPGNEIIHQCDCQQLTRWQESGHFTTACMTLHLKLMLWKGNCNLVAINSSIVQVISTIRHGLLIYQITLWSSPYGFWVMNAHVNYTTLSVTTAKVHFFSIK